MKNQCHGNLNSSEEIQVREAIGLPLVPGLLAQSRSGPIVPRNDEWVFGPQPEFLFIPLRSLNPLITPSNTNTATPLVASRLSLFQQSSLNNGNLGFTRKRERERG